MGSLLELELGLGRAVLELGLELGWPLLGSIMGTILGWRMAWPSSLYIVRSVRAQQHPTSFRKLLPQHEQFRHNLPLWQL